MPPVRSVKNQYHGINAHLQSWLQYTAEWNGFHFIHIGHLATTLTAEMRPLGYAINVTLSIQVDEFTNHKALAIYKTPEPYRAHTSEPVVWLELSVLPKHPTQETAKSYEVKRKWLLEKDTVFIEINYLHQNPPTFGMPPSYPASDRQPHPYHIVIANPCPDWTRGISSIYGFKVDAPIPTMAIPLSEIESLNFDFNVPYRRTYEFIRGGDKVDYTQLPVSFDAYSPADQTRIAARMLAVVEAAARDDNLESGDPLPVRSVTLDEALAEIKRLTQT